jgi:hypothetical protein
MPMPEIGALFPIYAGFGWPGNSAGFQHDAAFSGKLINGIFLACNRMPFRPGVRIASNILDPMPEEARHERPRPD